MRLLGSFSANFSAVIIIGGLAFFDSAAQAAVISPVPEQLANQQLAGSTGAKFCGIETALGEGSSLIIKLNHPRFREIQEFVFTPADLSELDENDNYTVKTEGDGATNYFSLRLGPDEKTILAVILEIRPIFGMPKTHVCMLVSPEQFMQAGGPQVQGGTN